MMTLKTYVLFLLLSFASIINAQNAPNKTDAAGKKQGHWIKLDDNKKKIYEGDFVDDYPVGKFTYFYDIGIPWSVTMFSAKGKVAYTKMYDAGGKLSAEGKYIDQKKDSVWNFYNSDGKIISTDIYKMGVKNGNCKVFYPSGELAEEKMWKDGKLNGKVIKYFDNGQIKYSGQAINDKVEGKVTFYYANGIVQAEGLYLHDVKDGEWKFYKEDGKIKRTDTYRDGRDTHPEKRDINKDDTEKAKKQYENTETQDPFKDGVQQQPK